VAVGLVVGGLAATVAGWLWGQWFPINKSLWTSSYALFMAGLAALALAACYWTIEGRGWRRAAGPFVVLGVTALPLFFLSSLMARLLLLMRVGPDRIRLHAWLFDHLFAPWLSPFNASLAYGLAYVLLWWGLMWALHRSGLRLRV
jgi:predicted acyltransferase